MSFVVRWLERHPFLVLFSNRIAFCFLVWRLCNVDHLIYMKVFGWTTSTTYLCITIDRPSLPVISYSHFHFIPDIFSHKDFDFLISNYIDVVERVLHCLWKVQENTVFQGWESCSYRANQICYKLSYNFKFLYFSVFLGMLLAQISSYSYR